jgi:hypothetical protein
LLTIHPPTDLNSSNIEQGKIMECINKLVRDINIVFTGRDVNTPERRNDRIAAIAFRAIGILAAAYDAWSIGGMTVKLFTAAGAGISLWSVCFTTVSVVLAHDLMIMGGNLSRRANALNPTNAGGEGILRGAYNHVAGAARVVGIVAAETARGTPVMLHGTWACEPLYKLFAG